MLTNLLYIFEKVKKDLKLSQEFRIEKGDFSEIENCYWIYYKDKLVSIINSNSESVYGFADVREEIMITLLLTKVLVKKKICRLKKK